MQWLAHECLDGFARGGNRDMDFARGLSGNWREDAIRLARNRRQPVFSAILFGANRLFCAKLTIFLPQYQARRIELAAHSTKVVRLGQTTGREKAEAHHQALLPIKALWFICAIATSDG